MSSGVYYGPDQIDAKSLYQSPPSVFSQYARWTHHPFGGELAKKVWRGTASQRGGAGIIRLNFQEAALGSLYPVRHTPWRMLSRPRPYPGTDRQSALPSSCCLRGALRSRAIRGVGGYSVPRRIR